MRNIPLLFLYIFLSTRLLAQDCPENAVTFLSNTQDWGYEMGWELYDETGSLLYSFQGEDDFSTYDTTLCLSDGCYLLEFTDSYGDGWNGGSLQLSWPGELLTYALADGDYDVAYFGINEADCIPFIPGCTDPESYNYDPLATSDDGSCVNLQDLIALQEIDTICYNGPKDNRINWVIQNRGTSNPNDAFSSQAEFVQAFEDDLLLAFTYGDQAAKTPYAQYKNFFNLYAAYWPDAPSDEEWWSFDVIKDLRDSMFLPWANEETGWATWFSTTRYGGGGGAGLIRELRVGDGKMFGMGWETLLHEFSHTMPGLPDEYSASGEWSGGNCWESGNTTGALVWEDIPWRLWVDPATPLPTPYTEAYLDSYGAFEGALTNYFGCHRPSARNCIMGAGGFGEDYGQGFCAPCVQRTICFLYKYVHVIENPQPANPNISVSGNETVTFSADILKPEPNTQMYEWFLNGQLIAHGVESVDVSFGPCDQYELTLAVTDTTSLVRYDPKFEEIYPRPYQSFTWTIDQSDVSNYDLQANTEAIPADCTGEANGQIVFIINGGEAPYAVFQNGSAVSQPLSGLAPGTYQMEVVDANGCSVSVEETVGSWPLLNPQVCSNFENGSWTVWVDVESYDVDELDISWSTGGSGPMIEGLDNGNYEVTLVTDQWCARTISFNLAGVSSEISVDETVFASEADRPGGQIYLDINGGLPPYQITWSERLNRDVTDANPANIEASGDDFGHLPEFAFDDDLGTKWLHFTDTDAWISYFNPAGAKVEYYCITSGDDVPGRDPKTWLFQGSDNGQDWTTLDSRTEEDFPDRFLKRCFIVDNPEVFEYYRFFVLENSGDASTQLQELEFYGIKTDDTFIENPDAENLSARTELLSGEYRYLVKDSNLEVVSNTLTVGAYESFIAADLIVVQDGNCQVRIETPDPAYQYYWYAAGDASVPLETGSYFQPPASGGYNVFAYDPALNGLSDNKRGFAVQLAGQPTLEITPGNQLTIVDPDPTMDYYWYDSPDCVSPLAAGTTFSPPGGTGWYYADAISNIPQQPETDPGSIPGIILRMDASDLDGDGMTDEPQAPTSSLLDWYFPGGNQWAEGNWFAYRSHYQNGLGVADFATIWLQSIETQVSGYQTILMAYEENPISFPQTAPFEGLSENIPRDESADQLFAGNAPPTTLNGSTFLNGEEVDPLSTPNPLDFCILGVSMTEPSNSGVNYTDTQWEGKIGELILWETALSEAEMKGVSEYLRRKWISMADLSSPKTGIFWQEPTSTKQAETGNKIKLYPNPGNALLNIEGMDSATDKIQIYSMTGSLILSIDQTAERLILQMENLPRGMYTINGLNAFGKVIWTKPWIKS
ncbi:MAG: T9SS type A sorting domain-containing protein [Bacteroidetes bacterium]|nr:T9SS type A sorting domain-containing protein [Bacteroidota bacterium]